MTAIGWHDRRAAVAKIQDQICDAYISGLSSTQVAQRFGVNQRTVLNVLRRNGVRPRERTVANSLLFKDAAFYANHVAKRQNKPSGAAGKRWRVGHRVFKPSLREEKNPQWKGGKTPLIIRIRTCPEYATWRADVLSRDQYRCVDCGRTAVDGASITTDHIVGLADLLVRFSILDWQSALDCDAIWDRANGRTLCLECHRKTPTWGRSVGLSRRVSHV